MTTLIIADRDGTLIQDSHYLSNPRLVSVIPGVLAAIKLLEHAGIDLIVASNQSGVGRGFFDEACVDAVNRRCQSLIDPGQKVLKHFFYCTHSPDSSCNCRKPLTGMLDEFLSQCRSNYTNLYVVGDRLCDLELGRNLMAMPILVLTGKGRKTLSTDEFINIEYHCEVAETFYHATELIVANEKSN